MTDTTDRTDTESDTPGDSSPVATDGTRNATDDQASAAADARPDASTVTEVETRPVAGTAENTPPGDSGQPAPLFSDGEREDLASCWSDIQAGFVDDPRDAVKQADALVAQCMQRLRELFADERSSLESQWEQGQDVDTEDLRVALRQYRSFFERLLSV